jgi:transcriptional regulator with XRE-family HTH domain
MNRLEYLRLDADMSRLSLSKQLNISPLLLRQIENEEVPLTDKLIYNLCSIFNVTSDYLLGLSLNKTNSNSQIISAEESELLDSYRKCSTESKRYLRAKALVLCMEQSDAIDYTIFKYLDHEKKFYNFHIIKPTNKFYRVS